MWSTGPLQVLCDYLGDDFYLLLQLSNRALLPEVFPLINEEHYFKYQLNQQLETVCRSTKTVDRQQLLSMIQADNGQMTGSFLLKAILPSMVSNDIDIFLPVTSTHDKTLTEKYLLECGAEITRDIRTTDDYLHHRGDAIIDVVDYTFYVRNEIKQQSLLTATDLLSEANTIDNIVNFIGITDNKFQIPSIPEMPLYNMTNYPIIPGMPTIQINSDCTNYNVTKMVFQVIRIDKTRYSVEQYIDRWFDFEIIQNSYNGKSFKIKAQYKIYNKTIDLYEMKWTGYSKMINRLYKYHLKGFTINICTPYFLQFVDGDTLQMETKHDYISDIKPVIMVPSNHHSMQLRDNYLEQLGHPKRDQQVTYVNYQPLPSEARYRDNADQHPRILPLRFNLPKLVMMIDNSSDLIGNYTVNTLLHIPDISNILNTYYNYINKALREYDKLIGHGHIYSNNTLDDGCKICNTAFTTKTTGNSVIDKFFSTFNGIEGFTIKELHDILSKMMGSDHYVWQNIDKGRSIMRNIYIKWLQRKVPLLQVITIK